MTTLADKIEALRTENSALQAENDRLNALIDAAAQHWMDLQFKHPIQWEGAIDGAMKAACDTILRALRERDQAVEALTKAAADIAAALMMSGNEDKIAKWVTPYVEVINRIDASIEGTGHE